MLALKRIFAAITGRTLVALLDHDGAYVFRVAHKHPFGGLACRRFGCLPETLCQLMEDGTVNGPCYVKKWIKY